MNSKYLTRLIIGLLVIILLAVYGGYWWGKKQTTPQEAAPASTSVTPQEKKPLYWYDPMYPQHRFDKPGKSPFMDMELVPVYGDESGQGGGVSINPRTVQNLGVRTASVEEGNLSQRIDTVGTLRADERRIEVVQARSPGWVERLHVKAVNDRVTKGQLLAEIYAPELLSAQEEFVLTLKLRAGHDLVNAARQRLSFLGFSQSQIQALENTERPSRHVAIYAPISGIVTELGVRQGMMVNPGMAMFMLVDLSTVWATAEIVEAQANWVVEGVLAEAIVPAFPGKMFKGRVDYIYPELDKTTRTLKARVVLQNAAGQLKPGMFANLTLYGREKRHAVLVPNEAVIQTGTRNVVIVAEGEGKFRPVEVKTGAEAAGKTEILEGLAKDQSVVVSGQFLIDSEASLKAVLQKLEGQDKAQDKPIKAENKNAH